MEKVVEEGMKLIKEDINLSTGFSHPSDRSKTIELLIKLKQSGYILDPFQIRQWAIQNEFSVKYAEDLKDFVEGVNAGKRYRTEKFPHWKDTIVSTLEQRANIKY